MSIIQWSITIIYVSIFWGLPMLGGEFMSSEYVKGMMLTHAFFIPVGMFAMFKWIPRYASAVKH